MHMTILILFLFLSPVVSISLGCFRNATFSNPFSGTWLFNSSNCQSCACQTSLMDAVAFNCYVVSNSSRNCLIFQNYSTTNGGVEITSNDNGSVGCFFQYPPEKTIQMTTERPTTQLAVTTPSELCSGNILSTVLLRLVNSDNHTYINYTYVYQATRTSTQLRFCFLNQQWFWALDDVSVRHIPSGTQLISNGGFEGSGWSPWVYYCSSYYGSGFRQSALNFSRRSGNFFYYDAQYSIPDGIYQNITTVPGQNYTVSFSLANPFGGNFSIAVVSIGS